MYIVGLLILGCEHYIYKGLNKYQNIS